ncbi:MAG TPA: hypothetical protein VF469_18955 [Kofleriaceae bacterium]
MRALACLALVTGCGASASPDPGLTSRLQLPGAQYRPGSLPAPSGGPDAIQLRSTHAAVTIGQLRERITGTLGPGSRSGVIGIAGEDGGWILPAGVPSFETPDDPSAAAIIGLADDFPPGPFTLVVAGGDADGRFGASAGEMLIAEPADPPSGELVIGLSWDGVADLDVHVVDPLGGEAWSDDPNTWQPPPPGEPVDPTAYRTGGILDRDGNASCHRDARPSEHVIWMMPPPSGAYAVRVDARSMCGGPAQAWYVAAYRNGVLLGAARGVSTDDDVQLYSHGKGAGVLALEFTL